MKEEKGYHETAWLPFVSANPAYKTLLFGQNDWVRAGLFKYRYGGQQVAHPLPAFAGLALFEAMLCDCREDGLKVIGQHMIPPGHEGPGFGCSQQPETGSG